ncbi:MAG: hypothetical protein ACK43N_10140, partial [Pirellulaceae bacterium]
MIRSGEDGAGVVQGIDGGGAGEAGAGRAAGTAREGGSTGANGSIDGGELLATAVSPKGACGGSEAGGEASDARAGGTEMDSG